MSRRNRRAFVALLTPLALLPAVAGITQAGAETTSSSGRLIFQEEFNGPTVDTAKWSFGEPWELSANGGKGYTKEKTDAWFINPPPPENLEVVDGALHVRARTDNVPTGTGKVMTSAALTTRGKFDSFVHGTIEARVRIPGGKSLWPTFWLLGNGTGSQGWPMTGEIDIFEGFNRYDIMGIHWANTHWSHDGTSSGHVQNPRHDSSKPGPHGTYRTAPEFGTNGDGQWHTFRLDRSADHLRILVDGVLRYEWTRGEVNRHWTTYAMSNVLFDSPMHVRFDLQVGGPARYYVGGDKTTAPVFETGTMEIDYVRVWDGPAPTTTTTTTTEPTTTTTTESTTTTTTTEPTTTTTTEPTTTTTTEPTTTTTTESTTTTTTTTTKQAPGQAKRK